MNQAHMIDLDARLKPALLKMEDRLLEFVAVLPLLLVAGLVVAIFWLLSRWVGKWNHLYDRLAPNRFLSDLMRQAVSAAVLLAGILMALEILGATALVGAVLGTAGVLGLALGFAFRDLVENYIASVLLSVRQPFSPNDLVDIDGRLGKVVRLTSRATILMTLDGNHLRIPNSDVFKGVILNYSRNPLRRFDFGVGLGTDVDLGSAQQLGLDILRQMEGTTNDPGPQALVEELGDSNVLVRFFAWVNQQEHSFSKVKSEAIRRVKTGLDDAGIDMPEPIYRLRIRDLPANLTIGTEAEAGSATRAVPQQPEITTMGSAVLVTDRPTYDLSADDDVDRQIAEDRASGEDLLSDSAPQE